MKKPMIKGNSIKGYNHVLKDVVALLETARRTSVRAVNAMMTTTYWEVGRRIVHFEQAGKSRAGYGEQVVKRLSDDLTARFGRGFGKRNLFQMRSFYLAFPAQKVQAPPAQSKGLPQVRFPLSWTHYVSLLSVEDDVASLKHTSRALKR